MLTQPACRRFKLIYCVFWKVGTTGACFNLLQLPSVVFMRAALFAGTCLQLHLGTARVISF